MSAKSSPRSSPIPSSLSASGLLTNFTKCFDGRAAVIDEGNNIKDAAGAANDGKQVINVKWGPSHSIDSEDESIQQHKKQLVSNSIGNKPSPSRSSQRTDPTDPITASTNKSFNHLSLKTGMSGMLSDAAVNAHHGGSGGNSGSSKPFWHNFNVSCADSSSFNASAAAAAANSSDQDNSHHKLQTQPIDSTVQSTPNNNNPSSPTAQLISQSAKAAAQAAASVVSMMESISIQVGSRVAVVNTMSGLHAVPFCGGAAPMEMIPERDEQRQKNTCAAADTTANNNPWDTIFCGRDDDKARFCQEFDYNAFREVDETASCRHPSEQSQNLAESKNVRAATTNDAQQQAGDTKGYEIRLRSTFSQQQIKTQRDELQVDRDLLPNLYDRDDAKKKNSTAVNSSATPSAFGRTHPNNQQRQSNPKSSNNAAVNTSTSSKSAATPLPIEYLSIPINNQSTTSIPTNNDSNTNLNASTSIQRTASEVSELTMRSHAERYQKYSADSRRMAYYAVGRVNENDTTGGNRRCYFTGIGIRYGEAFYAGSVRQGPR